MYRDASKDLVFCWTLLGVGRVSNCVAMFIAVFFAGSLSSMYERAEKLPSNTSKELASNLKLRITLQVFIAFNVLQQTVFSWKK